MGIERPATFGQWLKQRRRLLGLTQAELAARMNTSQSYIARLESGRISPSMKTWRRLAAATGTRPKVTLEPLTPS